MTSRQRASKNDRGTDGKDASSSSKSVNGGSAKNGGSDTLNADAPEFHPAAKPVEQKSTCTLNASAPEFIPGQMSDELKGQFEYMSLHNVAQIDPHMHAIHPGAHPLSSQPPSYMPLWVPAHAAYRQPRVPIEYQQPPIYQPSPFAFGPYPPAPGAPVPLMAEHMGCGYVSGSPLDALHIAQQQQTHQQQIPQAVAGQYASPEPIDRPLTWAERTRLARPKAGASVVGMGMPNVHVQSPPPQTSAQQQQQQPPPPQEPSAQQHVPQVSVAPMVSNTPVETAEVRAPAASWNGRITFADVMKRNAAEAAARQVLQNAETQQQQQTQQVQPQAQQQQQQQQQQPKSRDGKHWSQDKARNGGHDHQRAERSTVDERSHHQVGGGSSSSGRQQKFDPSTSSGVHRTKETSVHSAAGGASRASSVAEKKTKSVNAPVTVVPTMTMTMTSTSTSTSASTFTSSCTTTMATTAPTPSVHELDFSTCSAMYDTIDLLKVGMALLRCGEIDKMRLAGEPNLKFSQQPYAMSASGDGQGGGGHNQQYHHKGPQGNMQRREGWRGNRRGGGGNQDGMPGIGSMGSGHHHHHNNNGNYNSNNNAGGMNNKCFGTRDLDNLDFSREHLEAVSIPRASESSWIIKQKLQKEDKDQVLIRKIVGLLNRLTFEKFDTIYEQIIGCGLHTASQAFMLVKIVFEKAITQHHFIPMYVELCAKLAIDLCDIAGGETDVIDTMSGTRAASAEGSEGAASASGDEVAINQATPLVASGDEAAASSDEGAREKQEALFAADVARPTSRSSVLNQDGVTTKTSVGGKKSDFMRILLNCSQDSFESNLRPLTIPEELQGDDRFEYEQKYKHRLRGNMMFVGELFKQKLLAARLLITCLDQVFEKRDECVALYGDVKMGDNHLEAMCTLLLTVGRSFDTSRWKHLPEFERRIQHLTQLGQNPDICFRIRCLIKNVLDSRQENWHKTAAQTTEGPCKLQELRSKVNEQLNNSSGGFRHHNNNNNNSGGGIAAAVAMNNAGAIDNCWRTSAAASTASSSGNKGKRQSHASSNATGGSHVQRDSGASSAQPSASLSSNASQTIKVDFDVTRLASQCKSIVRELLLSHDLAEANLRVEELQIDNEHHQELLGKLLQAIIELCAKTNFEQQQKLVLGWVLQLVDSRTAHGDLVATLSKFIKSPEDDGYSALCEDYPVLPQLTNVLLQEMQESCAYSTSPMFVQVTNLVNGES